MQTERKEKETYANRKKQKIKIRAYFRHCAVWGAFLKQGHFVCLHPTRIKSVKSAWSILWLELEGDSLHRLEANNKGYETNTYTQKIIQKIYKEIHFRF